MTQSILSHRLWGDVVAHLRSPLYRNGYLLLLSGAASAGLGIVYWLLAARSYAPELVGLNSTLLAAMLFLAGVAQLGLNTVLVYFLPRVGLGATKLVGRSYLVSLVSALGVGLIFAWGAPLWAPALTPLLAEPWLLVAFVVSVAFWCIFTLQDSVLTGLRQTTWVPVENLLVAVLKIFMPFIFILPGIICFVLVQQGGLPALANPDQAYISMVKALLPTGFIGLALATLLVSVVNDVATGIGSFSTVFAIDFYGKRIEPNASPEKVARIGKRVTIIAGLISVGVAIFFASADKGLFELGQSLGTYLAPPVATVFILGLLWKGATPRAAELTLYIGTALCLTMGFCQLIDYPHKGAWPHFMLLCFYMMAGLTAFMVIVSFMTRGRRTDISIVVDDRPAVAMPTGREALGMRLLWLMVGIVMAVIYFVFR